MRKDAWIAWIDKDRGDETEVNVFVSMVYNNTLRTSSARQLKQKSFKLANTFVKQGFGYNT